MAGRRQHFIQQHLSRGFAINPLRRPAQVWVYRKGALPFIVATEKYGVQRDFYSSPEDTTVDDVITASETYQFDAFLNRARACASGEQMAAKESARFYQHLLFRSKNVRDVFCNATAQLMVHIREGILQKDNLRGLFTEIFRRHPDHLIVHAEQQLARRLTRTEAVVFKAYLEQNISTLIPQFLDAAWPALEMLMAQLVHRLPDLIATGHQTALRNKFLDDSGKRETEMRQLVWRVHHTINPLVLGDSCVFAEMRDGSFWPMADATMEVKNLYLPISSHRYLVGNATGAPPSAGASELNLAAIACSYESFCANGETAQLRELMGHIGQSVIPLSREELHRMANEIVDKSLSEQIARGLQ